MKEWNDDQWSPTHSSLIQTLWLLFNLQDISKFPCCFQSPVNSSYIFRIYSSTCMLFTLACNATVYIFASISENFVSYFSFSIWQVFLSNNTQPILVTFSSENHCYITIYFIYLLIRCFHYYFVKHTYFYFISLALVTVMNFEWCCVNIFCVATILTFACWWCGKDDHVWKEEPRNSGNRQDCSGCRVRVFLISWHTSLHSPCCCPLWISTSRNFHFDLWMYSSLVFSLLLMFL